MALFYLAVFICLFMLGSSLYSIPWFIQRLIKLRKGDRGKAVHLWFPLLWIPFALVVGYFVFFAWSNAGCWFECDKPSVEQMTRDFTKFAMFSNITPLLQLIFYFLREKGKISKFTIS